MSDTQSRNIKTNYMCPLSNARYDKPGIPPLRSWQSEKRCNRRSLGPVQSRSQGCPIIHVYRNRRGVGPVQSCVSHILAAIAWIVTGRIISPRRTFDTRDNMNIFETTTKVSRTNDKRAFPATLLLSCELDFQHCTDFFKTITMIYDTTSNYSSLVWNACSNPTILSRIIRTIPFSLKCARTA
jgi:hypothetical protein